jgi:hypothetical protein
LAECRTRRERKAARSHRGRRWKTARDCSRTWRGEPFRRNALHEGARAGEEIYDDTTAAAWLFSVNATLGDGALIEVIRTGAPDDVEHVVRLARIFATR